MIGADDFLTGVGGFPPGDILRYRLEDGSRVIVRPSGTEPKLKAYLDAATTGEGDGRALRERAAATVAELDAAVRALLGVCVCRGSEHRARWSSSAAGAYRDHAPRERVVSIRPRAAYSTTEFAPIRGNS